MIMRAIHFARILTLLVLTAAAAGRTNRVTIGTLTYLGTDEFGSAFRVTLDTIALGKAWKRRNLDEVGETSY
jgi:hypothetical protein